MGGRGWAAGARAVASAAASLFDTISRAEQFESRLRAAEASARARARSSAIESAVKRRAKAMRREASEQAQAAKAARAGMSAFAKLEASLKGGGAAATPAAAKPHPPMRRPPEEPKDGECCGSDCRYCVWTEYWEQLQAWQRQEAAARRPA